MDYNTLEKLGKAVLYGNILASIHTPAQTKVQFDTALEMYKKYVGNVYNDTLPAPADVDAVEGDRCLLNVNNDYEAYEVVDGVWKKYTTKEGATTEADLTDYYTKPEVREYVDNLIKDFIPKNGDNTFSGSNTFTKPIVGDLSGNADTATKATQDSEGNVIKDTYATKTECESKASLDATQMLAVNSGITASKVAEYEAMKTSKVNEADIKPVAKTGSYSDLINKPTINDSTINIKVNGVSIGTFTTNNANAKDIAITVPTKMSDLDNDSDYVASTTLHDYAKLTEVENKISELVNSAPETLDTLNELASALGNDPNFATTVATQIGTKANDSDVVHKSGNETISGVKNFSNDVIMSSINRGVRSSSLSIFGGTTNTDGSSLYMYGADQQNGKGKFLLRARNNESGNNDLEGSANGSLTWKGNQLAYAYNSTMTTFSMHIGSVLTNSGKSVSFVVPINIYGSPTITFTKLRIRSEGNYLFGSTGNSDVTTSYTFTASVINGGIIVTINFGSTDTKATNNSCVVTEIITRLTY